MADTANTTSADIDAAYSAHSAQLEATLTRGEIVAQHTADVGDLTTVSGYTAAWAARIQAYDTAFQQVAAYATKAAPSGSLTVTDNTGTGGTITVILDPTKIQDALLAAALVAVMQGVGQDKGPALRAPGQFQSPV